MALQKRYAFWFHYNKPASKEAGKMQWTLHYRGACHLIDGINCAVPTRSYPRNRQPLAVMLGKCVDVKIRNKVAYIQ